MKKRNETHAVQKRGRKEKEAEKLKYSQTRCGTPKNWIDVKNKKPVPSRKKGPSPKKT